MAKVSTRAAFLLTTALGCAAAQPASAQTSDAQISRIEQQIRALQTELKQVRQDLSARDAQVRAAQAETARARQQAAVAASSAGSRAPAPRSPGFASYAQGSAGSGAPGLPQSAPGPHDEQTAGAQAAGTPGPLGSFKLGGVTVTLGGFLAAEGLYRTRNETADIGSNFSTGIPLPNSANYHTGEFRGSARQSRLSLLIQGDATPSTHLAGYYETDFLSSGTTSNSTESNSYTLRLRQAYATVDQTDWGLHVLGGQAWSMMTMNRVGITPRQEDVPLTIDAQYVPGFNWARQWQLRVAKDFDDHRVWLGASLEEPQGNFYTGPNGLGVLGGATTTLTNTGGSLLNATNNYSDDIAPDVIVKAAWDPGYGHYEAFGVGRFLHDRVSTLGDGHNNTTFAGGVGGGFILPLVPQKLDFQVSGMAGYGIGRYGTSGLPDAIVSQSGSPVPIPEVMALAGLVGTRSRPSTSTPTPAPSRNCASRSPKPARATATAARSTPTPAAAPS